MERVALCGSSVVASGAFKPAALTAAVDDAAREDILIVDLVADDVGGGASANEIFGDRLPTVALSAVSSCVVRASDGRSSSNSSGSITRGMEIVAEGLFSIKLVSTARVNSRNEEALTFSNGKRLQIEL